ncbi:DUF1444 domain-containing protein [Tuberibacillus sp. Marseille-P3662]|uniref:DUF1444 domain-containing protein n=1 Tax=Tuberibacillus sp. Marseille-P3662 TaxID=1965358 RepID=UPI000A1CC3CD|nr:DUF1444 domain-containing protein [Tuberibacillus sp. Marseille-P3662]
MDSIQMKKRLEKRLKTSDRRITFNKKEDKLRIEDIHTEKGITLSLPGVISRYENNQDKGIDEVVYYVDEALKVMQNTQQLKGKEDAIYPVIRSTSFPTETGDGKQLLYKDHTAETRIFYAVDLDQSYRLIDHALMEEEGLHERIVDEMARFNLRSLPFEAKKDVVAGNTFFFVNYNDGYDASRILNPVFLDQMRQRVTGEMAVAVPHQDVLIVADIQNNQGYDILGQMTMNFFSNGYIPITSLPFIYEDEQLEPIFILAKNKPKNE